ncbi:hypothetical protein AX769_22615 (plasmid) [Frondihabitans sp. PAMC 28766]|nr:hypothetical protein AX769_22615 [Frondihabitans sp. PAMC 28766]
MRGRYLAWVVLLAAVIMVSTPGVAPALGGQIAVGINAVAWCIATPIVVVLVLRELSRHGVRVFQHSDTTHFDTPHPHPVSVRASGPVRNPDGKSDHGV